MANVENIEQRLVLPPRLRGRLRKRQGECNCSSYEAERLLKKIRNCLNTDEYSEFCSHLRKAPKRRCKVDRINWAFNQIPYIHLNLRIRGVKLDGLPKRRRKRFFPPHLHRK